VIRTHSHQFLGIHLQALAIAFALRLQLPWWKVDLYRTGRELATWTQMDTARTLKKRCLIHGSDKALIGSLLLDYFSVQLQRNPMNAGLENPLAKWH